MPAQLAAAGVVKNVIAHCLEGGNWGGGYLFLGDELVPTWGMTWTPMIKKHDEYVSVIFLLPSKISNRSANINANEPQDNGLDLSGFQSCVMSSCTTTSVGDVSASGYHKRGHDVIDTCSKLSCRVCEMGQSPQRWRFLSSDVVLQGL